MMTVINQDKSIKDHGQDFIPDDSFLGNIKFDKVDFHYPSNKTKVISNLTCEFEANKSTALFGVKCGKSTILEVLMGFYKTTGGEITIDGKSTDTIDKTDMRRNIGYVGENPFMFSTTIKENMQYANPNATEFEMQKCLESVGAFEILDKDKKLMTVVGDPENPFSGGQL